MIRKWISLLFCLAIVAMGLSGCMLDGGDQPEPTPLPPMTATPFTDRAAAYALYDQVTFEMTLKDVEALFGPSKSIKVNDKQAYEFTKDNAGVTVALQTDGKVFGKVLHYTDIRQVAPLTTGCDVTKAGEVLPDMPREQVEALMGGPGAEIADVINRTTTQHTRNRLVVWCDAAGNVAQVSYKDGDLVDTVTHVIYPTPDPNAPTPDPNAAIVTPDASGAPEATPATDATAATDAPDATPAPAN